MPLSDLSTPQARAGDWFTPRRFAALLALLLCAAFWPVLLGSESFYFRDFGLFGYPLAYYQRESFWRGELPLWNPFNNCGLPFLAQWNTVVLYPGSLIYLLLPLPWSLNLFCLGHLFLAGLGMHLLAWRWTGHRFAASLAGVAFALNGLLLSSLKWPNNIAVLAWMPWVVLLVERAWREGGRRILLAALVGALQMLAGTPELIALTWLLVLALWLGQWWLALRQGAQSSAVSLAATAVAKPPNRNLNLNPNPPPSLGPGAPNEPQSALPPPNAGFPNTPPPLLLGWRFLAVIVLVTGLSAAQLLPFFDLLAHSQRGTHFGEASWAMPWWGWANFLVPLFHCFRSHQGVFAQYDQYWISSYYVGSMALMLAWCAVWRVRRRRVWLLAAVSAVCLVLALGDQGVLYAGLRKAFPPLGFMRFPIKFVVLVVFALPLLAAFAAAHWESLPERQRGPAGIALGLAVAFSLAVIGGLVWSAQAHPLAHDDWGATWRNAAGRAAFLLLGAAGWFGYQRAAQPRRKALLGLSLLLVIALDVLTHAPWQNPTVPQWAMAPKLPELQPAPRLGESRAMLSPAAEVQLDHWAPPDPADDYLASRLGLFCNCNLLEAIPKVDGFYSLYLREGALVQSLLYRATNAVYPRLADFLGVSQLTAEGRMVAWSARTNWLPLVTAGQKPVFCAEADTVRGLAAPDFAPAAVVFLPSEAKSAVSITNAAVARVLALRWRPHEIQFEIEAAQPALAVVAQSFYHPWRAQVNRRPAPVWRANLAFQALAVPAGRSSVRLVYRDTAFRIGAAISVLTLIGCSVAFLVEDASRSGHLMAA
jgi:hypothetical protein